MKKFHRIIAILFILTVLGLSVYHFVMPDRAYSAGEKRALEQFPELAKGLDSGIQGDAEKDREEALKELEQ